MWLDYMKLKKSEMPVDHGDLDRDVVEKYYRKAFANTYFNLTSILRLLSLINSFTRLKNFFLVGFAMLMNIIFSGNAKQKS